MTQRIPVGDVRFVKELYPRLKPHDEVVERYRAALEQLPAIVVARDGVLVDGYHRWQAHVREGAETVAAENLGNLTDLEIRKESIRRNSTHGQQMDTPSKRKQAGELYLLGTDEAELMELLSVTEKTLKEFLRDAKREEKARRQDELWDRWLDCEWESHRQAGEAMDIDHKTVATWLGEKANALDNSPPNSRQHFDVWQFATADKEDGQQSYFGAVPPQVIENLLWFYTEPGDIVVDPFAGSGTTIEVAKRMGRRVWASDIRGSHYSPHLPIHEYGDLVSGYWPPSAPKKAALIFLDPPYWKQAVGRYSSEPDEMAEMGLSAFYAAWYNVVLEAVEHADRIAYIISPTQNDDGSVQDHATEMLDPFRKAGWHVERRIIVPYSTQQATGQQVTWARENRRMLKLYRDLVVMVP